MTPTFDDWIRDFLFQAKKRHQGLQQSSLDLDQCRALFQTGVSPVVAARAQVLPLAIRPTTAVPQRQSAPQPQTDSQFFAYRDNFCHK